jgi:deoxyribonuclease V
MTTLEELEKEQLELAKKVVKQDAFSKLELIGGMDVGFDKDKIFCSIVVCDYKDMRVLEQHSEEKECKIRYIPGFRAQREISVMIDTFNKLKQKPDMLLINASGTLHPRKCGLASHLGVMLDQPVIGITKNALCGKLVNGGVILDNEVVGEAVVVDKKAKPIFVSVGHKVSLNKGVEIVKSVIRPPHLLPEPLQLARLLVKKQMRAYKA